MPEKRTWYLRHLNSRRSTMAFVSILCLFVMALVHKMDTSMAIASVAIGLAASNAAQKRGTASPPTEGG